MAWLQLHFETDPAGAMVLEAAVMAAGALSVALTDAADNPILEPDPDSMPLWASIRLSALFPDTASAEDTAHGIATALNGQSLPPWRAETLDDRDWARAWLADYHPLAFGRLSIVPSGFDAPPGQVTVHLDPGLAFGTGTHPTTALCLEWLAGQDLNGQHIIDYGCGSGILAIAALALGAGSATGIDHDPQALLASHDNAARNGIAPPRLQAFLPADCPPTLPPADIVLANILAGPLIQLADTLVSLMTPGGTLVMSGLLASQASDVMQAYTPALAFGPVTEREGWVLLTATRATGCTRGQNR